MMKIELDLPEITVAIEAYLYATFAVNVNVSELKVIAGRSNNEARIELAVETGLPKTKQLAPLGVSGSVGNCLEPLEPIEDEDELEEEVIPTPVETIVDEPKSETVAPLTEPELKPFPGSFFAQRESKNN